MLDGASSPSTSSDSGRGHCHSASSGSEADCSGMRTPSRWGRRLGWGGGEVGVLWRHACLAAPACCLSHLRAKAAPAPSPSPARSVASEEMPLSTVPLAAKKLDDRWGQGA